MSARNVVWIAVVIALLLTGCKKDAQPDVWAQQGQASWYGHPYDGRLTASGETYDMEKMTAAHRTFPFGTVLLVTNLVNNQTVQVRINDRGPFVKDRVIDLSHAAAQTISMPGVANVGIKVISTPPTRAADAFAVQVGSFSQRTEADQLRKQMQEKYGIARLVFRQGDQTWRILVGLEATLESADALAKQVETVAGPAFVVVVDSDQ